MIAGQFARRFERLGQFELAHRAVPGIQPDQLVPLCFQEPDPALPIRNDAGRPARRRGNRVFPEHLAARIEHPHLVAVELGEPDIALAIDGDSRGHALDGGNVEFLP